MQNNNNFCPMNQPIVSIRSFETYAETTPQMCIQPVKICPAGYTYNETSTMCCPTSTAPSAPVAPVAPGAAPAAPGAAPAAPAAPMAAPVDTAAAAAPLAPSGPVGVKL